MSRVAWLVTCGLLASCGPREPGLTERCVAAQRARDASAATLCEQAWRESGEVAAAVAAAHDALVRGDGAALRVWVERAPATVEGARILHFNGEHLLQQGDHAGAEAMYRRALALRVDRDPRRAANTAIALVAVVQSHRPAEQSIELARVAWEQAQASGHPMMRAMAAGALVEILVDLGELRTAQFVV